MRERLEYLAKLPGNWDGHGAQPPDMRALMNAEALLDEIEPGNADIGLLPSGGVMIEWEVGGYTTTIIVERD